MIYLSHIQDSGRLQALVAHRKSLQLQLKLQGFLWLGFLHPEPSSSVTETKLHPKRTQGKTSCQSHRQREREFIDGLGCRNMHDLWPLLQMDLEEQTFRQRVQQRSLRHWVELIFLRILLNFLVLVFLGSSFVLIYFAIKWSQIKVPVWSEIIATLCNVCPSKHKSASYFVFNFPYILCMFHLFTVFLHTTFLLVTQFLKPDTQTPLTEK